jgi:hypothetical protein
MKTERHSVFEYFHGKQVTFTFELRRLFAMEMNDFVKEAMRKVERKIREGVLDKNEEGYTDPEEMLLDWIWIELKEESPDKDAVIDMHLDDLYEIIKSSAKTYEDYQIILEPLLEQDQ